MIPFHSADRIEERGLTPLLELLDSFGGWPIALERWDLTRFSWYKLIGQVTTRLAANPVLCVYVDADGKNTSRNILTVSVNVDLFMLK